MIRGERQRRRGEQRKRKEVISRMELAIKRKGKREGNEEKNLGKEKGNKREIRQAKEDGKTEA